MVEYYEKKLEELLKKKNPFNKKILRLKILIKLEKNKK